MGQHFLDPDNHTVLLGGIPISGFAENTSISIEEVGDLYNLVAGVDGDFTRSKNLKRYLKVTFHLMSSSKSNAVLSAMVDAGLRSNGGADVAPLLISDDNGTSKCAGDSAWVNARPKVSREDKATTNEWVVFMIPPYVFFEGGT
jgi:hypothetical protein